MGIWPSLLAAVASLATEDRGRSFIEQGSEVPLIELKTADGAAFSSRSLAGKVWVLVFLRSDQNESVSVLRELKALERDVPRESWSVVGVLPGAVTPADASSLAKAAGFAGTLLLDADRSVYARLGVIAVPSLALIDGKSRVLYSRPGLGKDLSAQVRDHLRAALGISSRTPGGNGVPRLTAPRLGLARGLIEEGALDRAEKILAEAVSEEPTVEGFVALAEIHLRRKEPDKALKLIGEAREKFSADQRFDVAVGRALTALGRNDDAERALRSCIQNSPSSWEAHLALGELYEKLGRKDQAIREYKSAIDILRNAPPGK